jgi:hypothetical protein
MTKEDDKVVHKYYSQIDINNSEVIARAIKCTRAIKLTQLSECEILELSKLSEDDIRLKVSEYKKERIETFIANTELQYSTLLAVIQNIKHPKEVMQ